MEFNFKWFYPDRIEPVQRQNSNDGLKGFFSPQNETVESNTDQNKWCIQVPPDFHVHPLISNVCKFQLLTSSMIEKLTAWVTCFLITISPTLTEPATTVQGSWPHHPHPSVCGGGGLDLLKPLLGTQTTLRTSWFRAGRCNWGQKLWPRLLKFLGQWLTKGFVIPSGVLWVKCDRRKHYPLNMNLILCYIFI